ncbi:MAG TPA: oxygenase MpaB family protein [Pseudonocardiaceae bacterium]|jgi:hypothetical protein
MKDLSRRSVLSLGAALGLVGVTGVAPAWAWSPSGSVAGTGSGTDPWQVWDDLADPLMAGLLDNGQVPAVNTAMQSWVNNGDPLPSGLPAELTAYLRQVNALPSWADPAKLSLAADFNRRMSGYLFMLYSLGSGIMSTVIPNEARNVYYSAGGADMKARAAKTFTFGYDLSALNAFDPAGHFVVTANKTRLVHAAVRHLLPRSRQWESVTAEQTPISNGDILVTFHSLGTYAHRRLLDWHIPMSAADEDAYLHSWQVALHLLGVRDEFIPKSWADAEAQSAQVLTPILAPTPQGIELAQTLLGLINQVSLGVTTGFVDEYVRYVLSNEIGDWLELPRDYLSAGLISVGWPAYVAFREALSPVLPAEFGLFDGFVRGVAMLYLNNGTSPTYTPITLPTANRPGV